MDAATYPTLEAAIEALLAMRRGGRRGVEWVLFRRGRGRYELRCDPALVVRESHIADVEGMEGIDLAGYLAGCVADGEDE
jgi:hypothetical protein